MGRSWVALISALTAVFTAGCPSSVEAMRKADTRYRLANDAYARGNYINAVEEAERALKIYEKHAEAHHLLGLFYTINKPECSKAEFHYKKAIDYYDGEFSKAKNSLASLYINVCDRVDDAIPLLEECLSDIKYYKESWAAEFNMGRALTIKKRDDEAYPHFVRALSINPGMCGAYYQLGGIHNRRGEIDKAVDYFTKSTAAGCAKNVVGYLELGFAYVKWGKKAEAVPPFVTCAKLAPSTKEGGTCSNEAKKICADPSIGSAVEECRGL